VIADVVWIWVIERKKERKKEREREREREICLLMNESIISMDVNLLLKAISTRRVALSMSAAVHYCSYQI
jgi:hypothetical protein